MSMTSKEKEKRLAERRRIKWNETHKLINGLDHKLCKVCNNWFPSTDRYFYRNDKNGIDGLAPNCKECTKEKSKLNMIENRDRRNAYMKDWMKQPRVKEQVKLRGRKRRERGELLRWQRNNKDKIRQSTIKRNHSKKHEISNSEWLSCKEYFNNSCAYCGLHIDDHWTIYAGKPKKTDLHKEHVDDNGSNKLDNCVPSCKVCNSEKHQDDINDWYTEGNPKYSEERLKLIEKWLQSDYKLYFGNTL